METGKYCLVEGTTAEYYDCCTVKSENVCVVLGAVDFSTAVFVLAMLALVLWKSNWFRNSSLLLYIFLL